jgi:hypothetical protein
MQPCHKHFVTPILGVDYGFTYQSGGTAITYHKQLEKFRRLRVPASLAAGELVHCLVSPGHRLLILECARACTVLRVPHEQKLKILRSQKHGRRERVLQPPRPQCDEGLQSPAAVVPSARSGICCSALELCA